MATQTAAIIYALLQHAALFWHEKLLAYMPQQECLALARRPVSCKHLGRSGSLHIRAEALIYLQLWRGNLKPVFLVMADWGWGFSTTEVCDIIQGIVEANCYSIGL